MNRGSCLCGGVRFEITGKPLAMAYCHCSRCRKSGETAHVVVRAQDFHWLQGQDLVARYEPEAPWTNTRCFCRVCETGLGEPDSGSDYFPIAAQTLDDDPGLRPILHEQVSGKPAWYEITDGLPEYEGRPPDSAWTKE